MLKPASVAFVDKNSHANRGISPWRYVVLPRLFPAARHA